MTRNTPGQPSERRFGLMLSVVSLAVALYGFLVKSWSWRALALWIALGTLCGLLTLFAPRVLTPLNRAWFWLGFQIGRVVNPIVLGIVFFVLLTPVALIARLLGRDELQLQRRANSSYWKTRSTDRQNPDSFEQQF